MYAHDEISSVYGRRDTKLSPTLAAFVNGVAVSDGAVLDQRAHTDYISYQSHPSAAEGLSVL